MGARKEIRDALEEFLKHPEDGPITSTLERYLSRIAATGITLYPWAKLKPLIVRKMNIVMDTLQKEYPTETQTTCPNIEAVSFETMKKRLHDSVDIFNGIPFTIQRICELLTDVNISKQYRRIDKFMRGIEKNLIVVTTVDPFGNRIVGDPKTASNGVLSLEEDCLVAPHPCTPVGKTPSSWFSSLSNVVDSPDSYPNWKHSQEDRRQQEGVTSSSQDRKTPRSDDDCVHPPSKLFRPGDDEKTNVRDEGESTNTAGFTPLLTQLLNGSPTVATSDKDPNVPERCDSTEARCSGLLEIVTGKPEGPCSEATGSDTLHVSEARASGGFKEHMESTMDTNYQTASEDVKTREDRLNQEDAPHSNTFGFHGADEDKGPGYGAKLKSELSKNEVDSSDQTTPRDPPETASISDNDHFISTHSVC